MPGNRVDDAADGVAAVEQSCRTFNDFDSFNRQHVDRFRVIAGFKTETADAITILEHEHAIAVETANDGTRGARSETAFSDSELAVESFAE